MFLGIDIGGTTINMGLVENGRVVERKSGPSFLPGDSLQQTLDKLASLIESIFVPEVESIGIGVPSVVDTKRGIVYDAANIPSWKEVHLKEELEKRFKVPVSVNNDANCYALGATSQISGDADSIKVAVTLGTGVGIGVVIGSRILNGRNTGVGELSALPYGKSIIEDICSRKYFDAMGLVPAEVGARAKSGDRQALDTFAQFGENLAQLVNVVLLAYDPDCIVFGGGIANNSEFFHEPMLKKLAELFPYSESLKTLEFDYKPQSEYAIIGASML